MGPGNGAAKQWDLEAEQRIEALLRRAGDLLQEMGDLLTRAAPAPGPAGRQRPAVERQGP